MGFVKMGCVTLIFLCFRMYMFSGRLLYSNAMPKRYWETVDFAEEINCQPFCIYRRFGIQTKWNNSHNDQLSKCKLNNGPQQNTMVKSKEHVTRKLLRRVASCLVASHVKNA